MHDRAHKTLLLTLYDSGSLHVLTAFIVNQNVAARPPKTLLLFRRIRRKVSRARSLAFSTAHAAVARDIYDCIAPKISVPSLQLLQRVQA
jgi:hypothetical protein